MSLVVQMNYMSDIMMRNGVPVYDDKKHFEFLVLEFAQAGLSWITILRKRENYRKAYDDFNVEKVARYGEAQIRTAKKQRDCRETGENRSFLNNARRFIEIQKEFGSFNKYIAEFCRHKPVINHWMHISEVPANSGLSDRVSKDFKKRGFKFLGSTIVYSYLQATGIINDHLVNCFRHKEISKFYG